MNMSRNENGKLVVNGSVIPDGVVAIVGEDPPFESRVVTERAVAMTAGIFDFAKMTSRPDPNPPKKN